MVRQADPTFLRSDGKEAESVGMSTVLSAKQIIIGRARI